jgi:sugar/nucleoside kinase (ribokinase family)
MAIDGVFIGLSTIDVVYSVAEFPAANRKVAARSQEVLIGGPATNAAIAFNRLGGKATLVAAVGRHPVSTLIRDEFKKFAVDCIDLNSELNEIPSISSVAVDDAGRRNVVSANTARIRIPYPVINQKTLEKTKVVLVDGHAMQACLEWAKAAKELGRPVVLDAGSWKNGTEELLKSVHTVICSADFAAPGCVTESELVEYLQDRGVTNVAITHGEQPVRFFSDANSGEIPVPQVDVADTMGAGAVFHGAFCYYYATGKAFEEALECAAAVASESCRYRGTREWMEHLNADAGRPVR